MSLIELQKALLHEINKYTTSKGSLGNQPKKKEGDYWYKEDFLGTEGLSESIVSLFYSYWENPMDFVMYHECKVGDKTGCYSKDMLVEGYKIKTLDSLLEKSTPGYYDKIKKFSTYDKIKYVIDEVYTIYSLDISKYMSHILTLDAITINDDRHLNNFIFLISGSNVIPVIFDNGCSLFSDNTIYSQTKSYYQNLRKAKAKPFSSSFIKQVETIQRITGITPIINKEYEDAIRKYKSEIYSKEIVDFAKYALMSRIKEMSAWIIMM